MKVKRETVEKVLALFDDEDIYYIHSDKIPVDVKQEVIEKPKIKTRGEKNDRSRKRN